MVGTAMLIHCTCGLPYLNDNSDEIQENKHQSKNARTDPQRLSENVKELNRASRKKKIYEFHLQSRMKMNQSSSQAKVFPEHVSSQVYLTMYNHKYAFHQCNENDKK